MNQDQHIRTLQHLLERGDDFGEILEYFMDHLGENASFLDRGKWKRSKKLEAVVGAVATYQMGFEGKVQLGMRRLRRYGMWHGPVMIGRHNGQVLYYEAPDVGLVSFFDLATSKMDYIRFRVKMQAPSTLVTPAPAPQHAPN